MNARLELLRIDHPKLGDAESSIKSGLAAEIIAEARIGDLDDEQRRRSIKAGDPSGFRIEDEIRFEIGVRAQPEGRLRRKLEIVREPTRPIEQSRRL